VNVPISVWHPKDLEQSSREQLSLIDFDTHRLGRYQAHLTARPVIGPFGEETPGESHVALALSATACCLRDGLD
jgi:hypothetical protein